MKKAVFFDIDGTLIDAVHGMPRMSRASREAIRALQQAGHYTFIASGRPYAYLDPELLAFRFDGYVLMNGAVVMLGDKVIYEKPLLQETVQQVCNICEQNDIEYILQGKRHVYLKPEYQLLERFYTSLDIGLELFVDTFDRRTTRAYKMEFLTGNPAAPAVYRRLLQLPGLTGIQDPFHAMNLELYAASETKGTGILHALEYLHVPAEQSYAFGDGENDKEMMDTVGMSLVMGNAHPALRERADHLVPSVRADGVAEGIARYIL